MEQEKIKIDSQLPINDSQSMKNQPSGNEVPNIFHTEPALLEKIDLRSLPRHIAVIMDGNRRWAAQMGKHKMEGHHAGVKALREVVECALDINEIAGEENRIHYMTFYAFSKENWNRSIGEIESLMQIFEQAAVNELMNLHKRNIRIRIIGSVEDLPKSLVKKLDEMVKLTSENTGLIMHFALSYSGRWEIVKTARRLANAVNNGIIAADDIDETVFQKYLQTWDAPDPDLLIRTSGEMRISNFLLWQLAYSEIYVTEVLWPDFNRYSLIDAISEYQSRERRYGAD
jgi:undecaprenyl diphosphate synthase